MIPKIIHYCWFGNGPLPKLAQKCIASWKKYFPDYEIIEWNESNFDVNCCQYVKEAYEAKKWAFVSDYARFKILYKEGGIYFDTDVEVIKPFNDILSKGSFMGCENAISAVNPGLGLAVAPGLGLIKELLEDYERSSFIKEDETLDLTTVVTRTTYMLQKHGLKNANEIQTVADINIYPAEYFCPKDTLTGEVHITPKTVSIHHFGGSWVDNPVKAHINRKAYALLRKMFGENVANHIRRVKKKIKG